MAMQPYTGASSSSVVSLKKYDVFISFRGEDTRRKFTSYLYDALSKKVPTFIDENELEKGDEISSTLIKSIEEAYVSVVIFSENYASSKWCLNELVKILECNKDQGQIVLPVFYEVDPSHVRNQIGSYGQAFEKHEQDKHNKDKLQKWRNALRDAANLSGWDSRDDRIESNFIKKIVEVVLKNLNRRNPLEVDEELIGIVKKNEEVESLMKIGSNDVRILVLWGMGGIGKTTLAKDVFAKWSSQFQRRCFLENVREDSTRSGIRVVRNKLFSTLLELPPDAPYIETPSFITKLACEKSFIVLDDVATLKQANFFNIVNKCLGPGSRVIVTTRDLQICSQFKDCTIYEVEKLNRDDSLQLFCWVAFQKKQAEVGYEELLENTIGYCRGNPLAITVLGRNFGPKRKIVWESELEKLKKIPNRDIYDVLKLSYDDLDDTQKNIFLDIACFFIPAFNFNIRERYYQTDLLNACGFFAESGLQVLFDKALISSNHMKMHDLLVEMGLEIVKQESPKYPGQRSRLWNPEEVSRVLKYNTGTEVVEVIYFNISEISEVNLRPDSFKRMINLRYLHITTNKGQLIGEKNYTVNFLEGLDWLPDNLRHLYWDAFPLDSLPSSFCAENLVQINMQHSKLKKLWNGIQKLGKLMIIKLDFSKDLIEIPDLSNAPNLEIVSLNGCESLCQLHPSIFTSPKLRNIYLNGCKKIESLKTNIHSKSLGTLDLTDCSSLIEFSVTSEEMWTLLLNGTAIHEFPSSIWGNGKLTYLDLCECKKLKIVGNKLSNDPGLGSLIRLDLSGCTQINTLNLQFLLNGMQYLQKLYLNKCCNLETIPDNIASMPFLSVLCLRECCNLETIPDNIQNSRLEFLDLDECRNLKYLQNLPVSLLHLIAVNCTYLDTESILKNMLDSLVAQYTCYLHFHLDQISFLPGAQVPHCFPYCTTKASIDIPSIEKSNLSCFIVCIIFSEGLYVTHDSSSIDCTVYENKEIVDQSFVRVHVGAHRILISDHVLLFIHSVDGLKWDHESEGDYYNNLSFEFKYSFDYQNYDDDFEDEDDDRIHWSTKGIKGCGVFPVYWEHYDWEHRDERYQQEWAESEEDDR